MREAARQRLWAGCITASCAAVLAAMALPAADPFRVGITFWFILLCPGMAFVQLMDIGDAIVEVGLAVALSVAMGVLLALSMVYTHLWYPEAGLVIEIGIALGGIFLAARRRTADIGTIEP